MEVEFAGWGMFGDLCGLLTGPQELAHSGCEYLGLDKGVWT